LIVGLENQIVFIFLVSRFTSEVVISGLAIDGLQAQGGWNRAEVGVLERRYALKISWVKHYDQKAGQWVP
jgi:hypothetical protein